ncbi:MAG TPA: DUF2835 domain-containing protein [Dongiaceae bacterium]|jgi:hypothetical protein|nr:DUF2835 domain-containing protein [Dongiaceae bacterium]
MHRYEFQLRLSTEQYLDYYRGTVRQVLVRATNGQKVQFPAALLQKFVLADGIHGSFVLTTDAEHKVISLQRLETPPASEGSWYA